jgi:hypothetical protein
MTPKLRRRAPKRPTAVGIAGAAAGAALLVALHPAAGVPLGVGLAVAGLLLNIHPSPTEDDKDRNRTPETNLEQDHSQDESGPTQR